MNLFDRTFWDEPSAENKQGAKIPWDDPAFSRRMLANHLSQEHDWASRRTKLIARHTDWIAKVLAGMPSRILDLGCRPGFYTQALAARGHFCVGVDFSPASIEYARRQAAESGLDVEYFLDDIRAFRSEQPFDCIIMTFGEFNVFTRADAEALLANCAGMLCEGGLFLLEAYTFEAVQAVGMTPASWSRHKGGLFSDEPYICLQENFWSASARSALSRYFIIDAASAGVRRYAAFMQSYSAEEYAEMLHAAALPIRQTLDEETWPAGADFDGKLRVFVCRKEGH